MMSLDESFLKTYGGVDKSCLAKIINVDDINNFEDQCYDLLERSSYCNMDSFRSAIRPESFCVFSSNVESIFTAIDSIKCVLDDLSSKGCKISLMCFQECWISKTADLNCIQIDGYKCFVTRETCGIKGGLITYVSNDFECREIIPNIRYPKIWECQVIEISSSTLQKPILSFNVYRPPRPECFKSFRGDFCKMLNDTDQNSHEIFLNGDFNVNLLKIDDDRKANDHVREFYSDICAFGLYPKITLPTRFAKKSANLIDNTFCRISSTSFQSESGILVRKFSDHHPYFTSFHDLLKKPKVRKRKFINITIEPDDKILIEKLNSINIIEKLSSEDPSVNLSVLIKLIQETKESLTYTKRVKFNKYRHKLNPWMTSAILKSIEYKDILYKETIATAPSSQRDVLEANLCEYKYTLRSIIRAAKKDYYEELFHRHQNDIKRTWACINELLGRKSKNDNFPDYFVDDNTLFENSFDIAEKFNAYFSNIGHEFAEKLHFSKDGYQKYLDSFSYSDCDQNPFEFCPIDSAEVDKIIDGIKPKSSFGTDGISSKLLKTLKPVLSVPLSLIINQCFSKNIFPDCLKIAKVIPIFKKGDNKHFSNYRPISILPSLSKIFEKVIYNQLYDHFTKNNLFFDNQYGFRAQHSTEYAALELAERIKESLHQNLVPLTIFLDLSKAFDTLNYEIILWKLRKYGLHENSLTLIQNYFTNRKQYVEFRGIKSSMSPLSIGVPQGSILGPLFFIIYMNDISRASDLFKFILYADDTSLFTTHSNENLINKELQKVYHWLCENRLSLNIAKTNCMAFHHPQKIYRYPNLHINQNTLDFLDTFKFLGIQFDKELKWKSHRSMISKKIMSVIGVMNRMKKFLPADVKKKIYFSLINCHLNYGNLLWGDTCGNILKLQKKAVRIILCRKYNAHTEPLFRLLDLPTINDIVLCARIKFFNQHKLIQLPHFLQSLQFTLNCETHDHNTRRKDDIHQVYCHPSSLLKIIPISIKSVPTIISKKITHHEYFYSSASLIKQLKSILISNYSDIEYCAKNLECYSCRSNLL